MADSTTNAGTSNEGGQNQAAAGSGKTFTQEEVNALLAKQKREMNAKYENYDEYKAAYDKSQEEAEARKSELERERDRAAAAEAELDALKAKADQAAWVAAVSKETGVPPEALHGATEEEVRACGEARLITSQIVTAPKHRYGIHTPAVGLITSQIVTAPKRWPRPEEGARV